MVNIEYPFALFDIQLEMRQNIKLTIERFDIDIVPYAYNCYILKSNSNWLKTDFISLLNRMLLKNTFLKLFLHIFEIHIFSV